MVNDPSWKWELEHPGKIPPSTLKASWAASRKRLFAIIEDLVKWENTTNEAVLEKARAEIRKSWRETCELNKNHPKAADLFDPDKLPAFHDPFAGGGALPLEAQRLGLESYASDLNPVAALINKAMIEIPPKFEGKPPINPDARKDRDLVGKEWKGAQGLAEDVRYYGQWVNEEAKKRIGRFYPAVEVTAELAAERPDLAQFIGQKLNVVAWIWARTVKSPNPAFRHIHVLLASTFVLSSKEGKEAYVEPIVDGDSYEFYVRTGRPPDEAKMGTKLARGANFRCLLSGAPIEPNYIKEEFRAGRMGTRLLAIVAEGRRGRIYLRPTGDQEMIAAKAVPEWRPEITISGSTQYLGVKPYGLEKFDQIFSPRQLLALSTFNDLVCDVAQLIESDAASANFPRDERRLAEDGKGARAYSDCIRTFLGLAVSRWADLNNTLCTWNSTNNNIRALFSRQAIPMTWDFAELSVFGPLANMEGLLSNYSELAKSLPANTPGAACQADAQTQTQSHLCVVSTDPPYYDNVPYADLSDFFYVWLRRSLQDVYPGLFATITVPKAEELVAFAHRHQDGKSGAEGFFMRGMQQAMSQIATQVHSAFPVTIYYAFKQAETDTKSGTASTGWETFLDAVIKSRLTLCGTWPVRTEREARSRGLGSNALASSIVMVCRPLEPDAPTTSRRAFLRELNQVLPEALDEMTCGAGDDRSPVAPVDLSQAIIGPGMAVFSKYSAVLEADGSPMTVRSALQLINRFLAEDDFDHDTQFCLHWFEQHGWAEGKFGEADTLARAKGTSVDGVKHAGVVAASSGIVRLLKWKEYPADWDPEKDDRLPIWEALHHLIRIFKSDGESGAGAVLAAVAAKAEVTRQLAYRLYTLCERAGWAEDARAYNEIVTSWNAIETAAASAPMATQADLFG